MNSDTSDIMKLAEEFGEASESKWLELVNRALKGKDFHEQLQSETYDGITIAPLYRSHTDIDVPSFREGHWDIRQIHDLHASSSSNSAILSDLEGGVHSVELRLNRFLLKKLDDNEVRELMESSLSGVHLHMIGLSIDGSERYAAISAAIKELKLDQAGSFACRFDPLTSHLSNGVEAESSFDDIKNCLECLPRQTGLLRSNGEHYNACGATEATELAMTLAGALEYLRFLTNHGHSVQKAAQRVSLRFAATGDIFLTIAKLRAARILWDNIAENCSIPGQAICVESVSSFQMLTTRDPWVNILRCTAAAFGAVTGGADIVSIRAFDDAIGTPTALARRIARNIHHILGEESALHSVRDPANGSYYMDYLTKELAEAAWKHLQAIEAKGGMLEAIKSQTVQTMLQEQASTKIKDVSNRRLPVTGVSYFPLLEEDPWHTDNLGEGDEEMTAPGDGPAPFRISEPFERLRDVSDAHKALSGKRPTALLACIGELKDYGSRAVFASNAFAAGGIATVQCFSTTSLDQLKEKLEKNSCRIICLCTSDKIYGEHLAQMSQKARSCGAAGVFVTGTSSLATEGVDVDGYLSEHSSWVSILEDTLSLMIGEVA